MSRADKEATPRAARSTRRPIEFAALALLSVWAGFWAWFALMVGLDEGLFASPYPLLTVAVLAVLVATSWKRVRFGGGLLFAFALGTAFLFRNGASALLGVSLPAMLFAVVQLLLPPRE